MKTLLDFKGSKGDFVTSGTGTRMRDEYNQPIAIHEDGKANLIAGIFGDVRGGLEVAEANARLFANSKKVLEVLIEVRSLMNAYMPEYIFDKVDKAINESI